MCYSTETNTLRDTHSDTHIFKKQVKTEPLVAKLMGQSVTHTSQGTSPTVTLMSSLVAVNRSSPEMVITVPPSCGPLVGYTFLGKGSWRKQGGQIALIRVCQL